MTNPDEVKDAFYEDLCNLLDSVPKTDKLILKGDFNARVGCDAATWPGVIGSHGVGKCNSNGLLLLQTCSTYDLTITITLPSDFQQERKPLGCTPVANTGT
jgi:hypothetical protein